jgi:glycosyltransferase involved in cell wall biosynthesis
LKPHISIVTGTYNRATTLQRLVKSIRETIPAPIRYEHIIVDNGSTDGTAKWVQSQPDLQLIQLGEPMGAIHAFTKGAFAAKAEFVLMATDDITFPPNAIMRAYAHLQSNLKCGAVTFAHNKKRNEYKPDYHQVRKEDGKEGIYPYPQISLIRKWLGDKCDWWGANTGMKNAFTYGGDNWLGAKIIEYGYSVEVVEGAVNNEAYIQDKPREINQSKHRGDAQQFYNNFPELPMLRTTPQIPQEDMEGLRILFIAHWLNKRSRREKRALIAACEKIATVWEFDYYNEPDPGLYLENAMRVFKPHLVFSQIHNQKIITPHMVSKSRRTSPNSVWINWVGDFWPDRVYRKNIELWEQFDALLVVNMDMIEEMNSIVPTFPYLNTFEQPDDSALPDEPEYDIVFLGNAYSDARYDLWKLLNELRASYKVGLYGKVYQGRVPIVADGVNHYDYASGRAIYRRAKIAINTNEFAEQGYIQNKEIGKGYTSNRFFEIISAGGALCLHQRTPQFGKYTRAKEGTHYIQWSNLEDLRRLISHWLKPEQEKRRKKIVANARKHADKKHCADVRIKYVLTEIVPKLARKNRSKT